MSEPEDNKLDQDTVLTDPRTGEKFTVREFVQRSAERIRAAVRAAYGDDLTDEECGQVLQTIADAKKPPEAPS